MLFSAVVNRFIVKNNLILLLQMILKENIFFRNMFKVTDYAALSLETPNCVH